MRYPATHSFTQERPGYVAYQRLVPIILILFTQPFLWLSRTTNSILTTAVSPPSCNHTGVRKNANGSYSFSWLHVTATGEIVDPSNCPVFLRGFNLAGTEYDNAMGSGTSIADDRAYIAYFARMFRMNYWRVGLNTTWWQNNDDVPNVGMPYRQWLQTRQPQLLLDQ
jgi:hypothetical protein